jgi:glycosyltransferase involved in cell wall biosynthesis
MPPIIDILLPYRNAETTLPACLESIARQTMDSWRLIAIDDGSTDASASLLAEFTRVFPHTIRRSTGGTGLVSALNLGLHHATAPLVARMDADDTMMPSRLAKQAQLLTDQPDIGVASCLVEEHGYTAGFTHYLQWSNRLVDPASIATARFIESPMVHPSVCFRRALVDRYGGYRDGDFPEDYELWLRWMDHGVSFAKVGEPLLRWSDHDNRLTRTDPRYRVEAFFDIKAQYLARWLKRHNPFGLHVWVWGAGYATRRRVRRVCEFGIMIDRLIDIDPRKVGSTNRDGQVVSPDALPGPKHNFVLAAVGTRGARELITESLEARGYRVGISYLCIA